MATIQDVSIGMFTNVLVTLGCIFLITRALPVLSQRSPRLRSLLLGLLFGATSVASMTTAFPIADGIYGDMRNAIVAIAALSGGPLAGLVCAAFAILFRVALGGQVVGAISAILVCAILSVAFALYPQKKSKIILAIFGVVLALVNAGVPFIGWFMGIASFQTVMAVAEAIFGSAILLYPMSIVVVVSLINSEIRRLQSEATLRTENADLTLRERRFLNVFEVSCVPMAWIDLETNKLVRVNPECEAFTGYSRDELLNMTVEQLSVPEDRHVDLGAFRALASGVGSLQGERRYLRKDGAIRWGNRTLTLSSEESQTKFGFAIVQDITDQKLAGERITYLAEHDHLTGLANRYRFGQNLDLAMTNSPGSQAAVLVIDLDDFKAVNDTRGHPVGDKVLIYIADLLRSALEPTDHVARIGGDEFAVTRLDSTSQAAMDLAQHLIKIICRPFEIDGHFIAVNASAGIALSPADGSNTAELFKKADIALYASKAAGKGIARHFEPAMEAALLRRESQKKELSVALDQGELEVEYQPVLDIASGLVCRLEALLRWNHPTGTRVSPAEFIPVAEETGSILAIGDWVLEEACTAAASWPFGIGVAVNVSVRQVEPGLPFKIRTALSKSGLAPKLLEIEITESVLMQGSEESLVILREISALGVRISLDDFGTGYSSLSYLQRFPFNKLKIDKSFISGTVGTSEARTIVRSVIQLGHSLGMTVTAEGVETIEQLERIKNKGCDEAQGYLFSASVPAEEVVASILRINSSFGVKNAQAV